MEIFGKHIFGNDAEAWLKLCKDKKKEWILKYTNQKNEALIDEFVNNPKISKECKCLDCGKNKKNGISNGISEETTTAIEPIEVGTDSSGDSIERPKKTKRRKN
jgi:hypothetical protein